MASTSPRQTNTFVKFHLQDVAAIFQVSKTGCKKKWQYSSIREILLTTYGTPLSHRVIWLKNFPHFQNQSHCLYKILDSKKTSRFQFSIPGQALVQKCHFGNFSIFPKWHFWTSAWNLNFFWQCQLKIWWQTAQDLESFLCISLISRQINSSCYPTSGNNH